MLSKIHVPASSVKKFLAPEGGPRSGDIGQGNNEFVNPLGQPAETRANPIKINLDQSDKLGGPTGTSEWLKQSEAIWEEAKDILIERLSKLVNIRKVMFKNFISEWEGKLEFFGARKGMGEFAGALRGLPRLTELPIKFELLSIIDDVGEKMGFEPDSCTGEDVPRLKREATIIFPRYPVLAKILDALSEYCGTPPEEGNEVKKLTVRERLALGLGYQLNILVLNQPFDEKDEKQTILEKLVDLARKFGYEGFMIRTGFDLNPENPYSYHKAIPIFGDCTISDAVINYYPHLDGPYWGIRFERCASESPTSSMGSSFCPIEFGQCTFVQCSFERALGLNVSFYDTLFEETEFVSNLGGSFKNSIFKNCSFMGEGLYSNFNNCIFRNVNFTGKGELMKFQSKCVRCVFQNCTFSGVVIEIDIDNEIITLPNSSFIGVHFEDCYVKYKESDKLIKLNAKYLQYLRAKVVGCTFLSKTEAAESDPQDPEGPQSQGNPNPLNPSD